MKILHLSHSTLEDWRIIKSAISSSKFDNDVYFCGMKSFSYPNIFKKQYQVIWTAKARWGIPYYWYAVKKQIKKILDELRPDIIHAHNIYAAKMASEFDIPFVYNDHEHWIKYAKIIAEVSKSKNETNKIKSVLRKGLKQYGIYLCAKWEKEILSKNPTITVSDRIANDLKDLVKTSKIFVIPNFPQKQEIVDLLPPKLSKEISCVYQGRDGYNIDFLPHKNFDGLIEFFQNNDLGELTFVGWKNGSTDKIKYTGLLSRKEMFLAMAQHSIGLLPWHKHWSHYYLNPNKAFEYAHSGSFLICTSSLETVKDILKDNCDTIENYNDLKSKLLYYKQNLNELYSKRLKIYEFARKNLIWENYEDNIKMAYNAI
ncbi:MAG: hypothetical protein DA328_00395 [Nitrososphaeraceae archaeon]|nr:hypothetical protein [Nitrososphaeraceae archaeon]